MSTHLIYSTSLTGGTMESSKLFLDRSRKVSWKTRQLIWVLEREKKQDKEICRAFSGRGMDTWNNMAGLETAPNLACLKHCVPGGCRRKDWKCEWGLILRVRGKFLGSGKGTLELEVLSRHQEEVCTPEHCHVRVSGACDSQPKVRSAVSCFYDKKAAQSQWPL